MITIVMNMVSFELYINMIIGAIFCHVNIIKQFIHLNPSITSGNQKWNGAAPIFVNNEELIIITIVFLRLRVSISWLKEKIITENIRMAEARACVMKYLIEDSEENMSFFLSKGIMEIRLISSPIHIPIQE